MERFVKGAIVIIPFPFSDLSKAKRRPAMVLADLHGNDSILCQITSKGIRDNYSVPLLEKEFEKGSLRQESNIRPNKIFTADNSIIEYQIGSLKREKIKQVVEKACSIIRG